MKPGIYADLKREKYDRLEGVNFSTLKAMAKSPAHYRHALTQPHHDTDPMRLGRAVHLLALEPEKARTTIAVWDGGTRRGKDWDRFCDENEGRELLTEEQHEKAMAMALAVRADATAKAYLSNGRGEVTMVWEHRVGTGPNPVVMPCRGRLDFEGDAAIVDLKCTLNASPEGFGKQAWNLGMHIQAAWYSDAHFKLTGRRLPYKLVAVENTAPFVVQVYDVPENVIEVGRESYVAWLDRLAFCRETSTWPAYWDGEQALTLPKWALGFDGDDADLSELTSGGESLGGVEP